ncbi:hypothetical protein ACFVZC_00875 [Streptomyces marokkonensis]|uniref:Uncharacterized protein n=1 Tax=Streptomyces marokkonensis TaxID=324855 RepID=A0ABW6PYP4_9ACTN|nr:hypothetical protein [Streptomyces marokkonensis]
MTESTQTPTPAAAGTGMADHVLALAAGRPRWNGEPVHADDRVHTPHKAIRRVADHLIDHLAEPAARLAGQESVHYADAVGDLS